MNVTQRNYTVKRIDTLTTMKINALVAESDLLVAEHNKNRIVSFQELKDVLTDNPEVLELVEDTLGVVQVKLSIDYEKIRELLNKPNAYLNNSNNTYVPNNAEDLQTIVFVNKEKKVVMRSIADRMKKLQDRASYTKDLVMLGDAKEALQALEEFNSLVF